MPAGALTKRLYLCSTHCQLLFSFDKDGAQTYYASSSYYTVKGVIFVANEWVEMRSASGALVFNFHMQHSPVVAAGVLVPYGARYEQWPQKAGLAHFLEHLFFKGNAAFPTAKELDAYIEDVGGNLNAWTGFEATFFNGAAGLDECHRLFRVQSQQLLTSFFSEESIAGEKDIVIGEIRDYQDDPETFVSVALLKLIYGTHPLSRYPLGTKESVAALTRDDIQKTVYRWYRLTNFVHIVVGGLAPEATLKLVDEHYRTTDTSGIYPVKNPEPVMPGAPEIFIERNLDAAHISLGAAFNTYECPKLRTHLSVFAMMLDAGASFPLFQEVREKRGLCYRIKANIDHQSDASAFTIDLTTDPSKAKEAVEVIFEVIESAGSDSALLERTKTCYRGALAFSYESTSRVIDRAANQVISYGKPLSYREIVEAVNAVTIDNIRYLVDTCLTRDKFHVAILAPQANRLGHYLYVQILHTGRVRLNEFAPGLYLIAHKDIKNAIRVFGVSNRNLLQNPILRVHSCLP